MKTVGDPDKSLPVAALGARGDNKRSAPPRAPKAPPKAEDALRTIGEVADILEVPPHVLRFWETRFPETIRPLKRAGGRRYYRPQDVALLRRIKGLLYHKGHTTRGVRRLLLEEKKSHRVKVPARSGAAAPDEKPEGAEPKKAQVRPKANGSQKTQTLTAPAKRLKVGAQELAVLDQAIGDLERLRRRLSSPG